MDRLPTPLPRALDAQMKELGERTHQELHHRLVRLQLNEGLHKIEGGHEDVYADVMCNSLDTLKDRMGEDGKSVIGTFLSAMQRYKDNGYKRDAIQDLLTGLKDSVPCYFPIGIEAHGMGIEVTKKDTSYSVAVFNRGKGVEKHGGKSEDDPPKYPVAICYTLNEAQFDALKGVINNPGSTIDALYEKLMEGKKEGKEYPLMSEQKTGSCSTMWVDAYMRYLCHQKFPDSETAAEKLYLAYRKAELEMDIAILDGHKNEGLNELEPYIKHAQQKLERRNAQIAALAPPRSGRPRGLC